MKSSTNNAKFVKKGRLKNNSCPFLGGNIQLESCTIDEDNPSMGSGHPTKNGPSANFTAPTDQGTDEIRYFNRRNGAILAIRVFIVR